MSKWAALAVVVVAATAHADDKAVRKAEPKSDDKFIKAASETFAKARAADEAGKLSDALRLYEKANAISSHPNTLYNIADVQRRMRNIRLAIKTYQKYLEADPGAKDRAEVEKLIGELEKLPGTLAIEVEESDAQIFVDGEPLKGLTIELPDGDHVVDVITPISAASERCRVEAGVKRTCRTRLVPRVDGNVFLSGPSHVQRRSVSGDKVRYQIKTRFELEPGPHELVVMSSKKQQCTPIKLEVAKGDVVTYGWLDIPKQRPKANDCVTIPIKQRTLKF